MVVKKIKIEDGGKVVTIEHYITDEERENISEKQIVSLTTQTMGTFKQGAVFSNLKHLTLTYRDPCASLWRSKFYKFPNLQTLDMPFQRDCCKKELKLFTTRIIKENAYPWLCYCIKKSYPNLDKRLVKEICKYLVYVDIVEDWWQKEYEFLNKTLKKQ
jgi:hypothetical protein